ncbi:urease accessory protein UreE [Stenotrophobium rhamnosiphilum]|uniref:Urease accessory protein UreE n=1 Tax=Stenotrophobium rhamnosiphilum TaxID=2029166 RepID=A0A2T5MFG8_9GAMM|nr:urease accessory protein UreE [Stenotrophobium rhamnosiphilum]PTU31333.1 urease accessory protein UreE [Stenotrophobium rhamnosiphilum]
MLRASELLKVGQWSSNDAADSITLDYDERHRRRFRYVSASGVEFLLDLARATVLQDGDGLRLTDGLIIVVRAAPEALTEIRADSPAELLRLAWHIGNRHLPAQLAVDCIYIREDYVITDMLRGLGATVRSVHAPFSPEQGAYAGGHGHHDGAAAHPFVFAAAPTHGH